MAWSHRFTDWLETHWVNPSYGGWVLGGLSSFFFLAATNTLAGWLYVLSGVGLAIVLLSAYWAPQELKPLRIERLPIDPVSAGDRLRIRLLVHNASPTPKLLLQVRDRIPLSLGEPQITPISEVEAQDRWQWLYEQPAPYRGIYRWHQVDLRTAAPLGLFWHRCSREAKAKAIVYPTVLPLSHCPLLDELGKAQDPRFDSDRRQQVSTEGVTRTLRPYRWGDPMRFIHWRTSARYGELRVRELEIFQGGQDLVIALDSQSQWHDYPTLGQATDPQAPERVNTFEQAVITAASLYFYALHRHIPVKLWTADGGLQGGERAVLETLAATQPGESPSTEPPHQMPLVWLTQNRSSLAQLPPGSGWVCWAHPEDDRSGSSSDGLGLYIWPETSLESQLQGLPSSRPA